MLIRSLDFVDEIRQFKVDVVTVDGQSQSGKGVLVGGYHNESVRQLILSKSVLLVK